MADSRVFEAFEVFELALVIGRQWGEQEGINASYLDGLSDAVARYDGALPRKPEPQSIRAMRVGLQLWQRQGVCPEIVMAQHACVWTCRSCGKMVPPTRDSQGNTLSVRCRTLEEREEQAVSSKQQAPDSDPEARSLKPEAPPEES